MSAAADWLEKYPFLRLDIPWMAGILCGYAGGGNHAGMLAAAWVAGILVCLWAVWGRKPQPYSRRWVYGAALNVALFLAGACWMGHHRQAMQAGWDSGRQAYRGTVSGIAEERARSLRVPVEVEGRQVLLYLPKDAASAGWRCGDEILFHARIHPPLNRGNAEEFDYARYLEIQGIGGTAYAPGGRWQRGSHVHPPTWKQQALMLRGRLVQAYRSWGLEGEELAVMAALTLGDKSLLDADLKTAYSVAGASHILALSGLHLGIIYALLGLLVGLRPQGRRFDALRGAVLVAALWGFAYLTGLSGSVVRAAVMFTVVVAGRCLRRAGSTLNSLALAAFVMLVYNPYYLFDVGFQMSFFAVAGIVFFGRVLSSAVPPPRNAVVRYVWGIVWVSVAAQLGVAPLVAFYFGNFPLYFLVANLVVIPLSFLLLCGGIALWAVSWLPLVHGGLLEAMRFLLGLFNSAVVGIGQWPFSSLQVEVGLETVVVGYAGLLCWVAYRHVRHACCLHVFLVAVCAGLVCHFAGEARLHTPRVHFYSDRWRGDVVACRRADGSSFLVDKATDRGGIIALEGKYIGVFQDGYWMDKQTPAPLPLEVAYIRKEFRGDFRKLCRLFAIRRVVLEASVGSYRRKQIEAICRERQIEVISLDDVGSWQAEV